MDYLPVRIYFFCDGKRSKHTFHTKILSVTRTSHSLSHFQAFVHDFPLPGTSSLPTPSPDHSSYKSGLHHFPPEADPEPPSPASNLAKLGSVPPSVFLSTLYCSQTALTTHWAVTLGFMSLPLHCFTYYSSSILYSIFLAIINWSMGKT